MSNNEQAVFTEAQLVQLKMMLDKLGPLGALLGQQAGGGGAGSGSSNPTETPGTGAAPSKDGARTDPKRPGETPAAVGGLAKKPRSDAQKASGRSSEKEEKSDRSDGDLSDGERGGGEEEEEEDGGNDLLGSYDFCADAFEAAKYSKTLFTTVLPADQKIEAMRGLNTRPSNAPKVSIPDLTVDAYVTDVPKAKVADMGLKVKDIAPIFRALSRVDGKLALLILNLLELLGTTDPDNKEAMAASISDAMAIARRMADVAEVGRSEKAAFKAALFLHVKQKNIPLSTALKIINKKEMVSVFADPHVKETLTEAANFNDQVHDIGASLGPRTFFRGSRDRPGVQKARVQRKYGEETSDSTPQRVHGRGRGNLRGSFRSRGSNRGSNRGSGRGNGRGHFKNY